MVAQLPWGAFVKCLANDILTTMNKTIFASVAGIILLGGGLYILSTNSTTSAPQQNPPTPTVSDVSPSTTTGTGKTFTIKYTASGFTPASLTLARGDTVVFTKDPGSRDMWVAGGHHPTHESLDGTTRSQHCATGYTGPKPFDACAVGTQYSYTFEKVGVWTFHNHYNASDGGTITVQ